MTIVDKKNGISLWIINGISSLTMVYGRYILVGGKKIG